jgi:hypothetical protein
MTAGELPAFRARPHQNRPALDGAHPGNPCSLPDAGWQAETLRAQSKAAERGYLDMMELLDGCTRVLTDSGGLQKEAYFFRKPTFSANNA